jgi:hypothetical protein
MGGHGAALRSLVDADALLRVLLRSAELTDPRTAFFIRNNERDTGLSVNFDLTPEECRSQTCFEKTYGVRRLLVKSVRGLALEAVPDDINHANVTGIPHKDDDPARAEFLAGRLLEASELVLSGLRRNR